MGKTIMNLNRVFLTAVFAAAFCAADANTYCRQAEGVSVKEADTFNFAPPYRVSMEGELGKSMDTCMKGDILSWDIDDLVRPFKVRNETKRWQIEFGGKWFTSAKLAYDYQKSDKLDKRLDYAVSELLSTRGADGSITTYKKENELSNWDHWGRKYVMLGLLAEYERTGGKKVLDALKAHADCILEAIGDGEGKKSIIAIDWWGGLAAGSILEPMVLLYRETGEKRYLDFADYIVKEWSTEKGPKLLEKALANTPILDMFKKPTPHDTDFGHDGRGKAYEMMSCYEGLLELYRVEGKADYKKAVENVAQSIFDTEITVLGSGSMHERWIGGKSHQTKKSTHWMETCVSATWMKLCSQLLRMDGDAKYANWIERDAYNVLIGAQGADGTWWAHFSPMDGFRKAAPEHCNMHMNCCVASGPRALFLLPRLAYMQSKQGAVVNFYESGEAALRVPDGEIHLEMKAPDFVFENTAKIRVSKIKGSGNFEIKFRIPEWSAQTVVSVNGENQGGAKAGEYLSISRAWKNGDVVTIVFDISARLEKDTTTEYVALKKGPYVYAQDKRYEPDFDKDAAVAIKDGKAEAVPAKLKGAIGALDVKLQDGKTRRFVPYPSAGTTWDENSEFRVWFLNK